MTFATLLSPSSVYISRTPFSKIPLGSMIPKENVICTRKGHNYELRSSHGTKRKLNKKKTDKTKQHIYNNRHTNNDKSSESTTITSRSPFQTPRRRWKRQNQTNANPTNVRKALRLALSSQNEVIAMQKGLKTQEQNNTRQDIRLVE